MIPSTGAQQIFNLLIEFFEEDEWDFSWTSGTSALILSYEGDSGHWSCVAHAIEPYEQFIFYSMCPLKTSPARLAAMAEFLHRANFNLTYGSFEIDYDDGEIRFRTAIDVEGADLSPPLIRQVIYGNVVTFDHYFKGIQRVLDGEAPRSVIAALEYDFMPPDAPDDDEPLAPDAP